MLTLAVRQRVFDALNPSISRKRLGRPSRPAVVERVAIVALMPFR